jgi:hypothetical protein
VKETSSKKFSKEEIIAAIQERAAELGRPPKRGELIKILPITASGIARLFGSYRNALWECGMEREGCGIPVKLDRLFDDWARIVRAVQKIPTVAEYGMRSAYGNSTLRERYGSWSLVPAEMVKYARENGLEPEWADVLEMAEKYNPPAPTKRVAPQRRSGCGSKSRILSDRPVYGAAMLPQPMCFAPVNEMGVVFLFGAIGSKLGFIVTYVGTQYPDIEAFREVAPGRWQRVRIEAEYLSRNFLQHFHDPEGCDLIVCWENNWPEAPMEVIELKEHVAAIANIAKIG